MHSSKRRNGVSRQRCRGNSRVTVDTDSETFIREAFCLVLARQPSANELRDQLRDCPSGGERTALLRFLSSPEFRLVRSGWKAGTGIDKDPVIHEDGLQAMGSPERFVACAYRWLFDRDADQSGLTHYVGALGSGLSRV